MVPNFGTPHAAHAEIPSSERLNGDGCRRHGNEHPKEHSLRYRYIAASTAKPTMNPTADIIPPRKATFLTARIFRIENSMPVWCVSNVCTVSYRLPTQNS
eukprot:Polyplicarium_translucidae@DN2730_c0_g1_i5.p3